MPASISGVAKIFATALVCAALACGLFGVVVAKTTNIIASTPQSIDMSHYGKL